MLNAVTLKNVTVLIMIRYSKEYRLNKEYHLGRYTHSLPPLCQWTYLYSHESFGRRSDGIIVHIFDTSTWAGVFKNGLSLDYDCGFKYLTKPVKSVVLRSEPINIPQKNIRDLDTVDDYDIKNKLKIKFFV
jgi:hypothetical protein